MLQSVNSFLSPPVGDRTTSPPPGDDDIIIVSHKDGDIILRGPEAALLARPSGSPGRQFPLKVRCRAGLQKIPVLAVRLVLSDGGGGHRLHSVTGVCLLFSPRPWRRCCSRWRPPSARRLSDSCC